MRSYLTVKDDPHAKAVLDSLTIEHTLLFVGCGDTVLDPNFTRLIEWGKEALKDVAPRHYLLCRTLEIADFQKKLAGAPWLQPLDYGRRIHRPRPLLPRVRAARRYRGLAEVHCRGGRAELRSGFLPEGDAQSLRPAQARSARPHYARHSASYAHRHVHSPEHKGVRDEETLVQHRRAYLDQSQRPVLEVINDPALKRVGILGDPGSGKSTLLQYLLLQWAEKTAPNPQQDPLPLLIELREYARLRHEGNATSYLEYLHHGASVRWHFDQAQLNSWLKTNPSVVLFDGLDEVFDPTLRNEVSHSHSSFCRSIHLRPRPGYLTRHRLPAPRVARRGLPPLHAARVG